MIDRGGADVPHNTEASFRLAELTEEITRRLQAGEVFDAEAYVARHSECAESIRDLMPTMHDLVELGRSLARRAPGPPANGPIAPPCE